MEVSLFHCIIIFLFTFWWIQRILFSSQGAEAERFSFSDILICHLSRSCIIFSFFKGVVFPFQIKVQNYRMLVLYSIIAVWQLFHLTTRSLAVSHFDRMKRMYVSFNIWHISHTLTYPTLYVPAHSPHLMLKQ